MPGALTGLRVLDLTRLLPGAVATLWLADEGAEVIKVEQPETGDYARASYTSLFEQTNRGKKSIELDLKQSREAFLKLAATADILIEGFRPGVMDRLNLGCEALQATNPRLIYVSLTGYGQKGPHAMLAGHDVNYLALAGILDLNRDATGVPVIPGVQIADLAGGSMQAVIAILLALEERHRTGAGKRIDISMTDGLSVFRQGPIEILSGRHACYRIYRAAENTFVAVGALEPKFWSNLCRELGRPDVLDQQFSTAAFLDDIFLTATAEQWFERLGSKDCCVTPVRKASFEAPPPGRAPLLGEHNKEFL